MTDCVTEVETNNHAEKPHPKNINVRAAFIHVIGDIIQSLGVLLASIIIKIKVRIFLLPVSSCFIRHKKDFHQPDRHFSC